MDGKKATERTWFYPLSAGLLGLLMAWLVWDEQSSRATNFFVGVLVGISTVALLLGVVTFGRERSRRR